MAEGGAKKWIHTRMDVYPIIPLIAERRKPPGGIEILEGGMSPKP